MRLLDTGDGLHFALVGMMAERRLMLESLYGYLVLKNGVPIGYGSLTALFESAEIALNIFPCYRAGEAATVFAQLLRVAYHELGADTFSISPYQLGEANEEAIASGAWWFYQKMGFRARDPGVLRLMRRELKRISARTGYRSPPSILRQLAVGDVFLHLGPERDDVLGLLDLPEVSRKVSRYLSARFGSERKRGEQTCGGEAAALLGVRSMRAWSRDERVAWRRWSPLLLLLPGVARWSRAHQRALVHVVRSKGAAHESTYTRKFDAHRPLRAALLQMTTA